MAIQKHLLSIILYVKKKIITVFIKKFPRLTFAWQLSEEVDLPALFLKSSIIFSP